MNLVDLDSQKLEEQLDRLTSNAANNFGARVVEMVTEVREALHAVNVLADPEKTISLAHTLKFDSAAYSLDDQPVIVRLAGVETQVGRVWLDRKKKYVIAVHIAEEK